MEHGTGICEGTVLLDEGVLVVTTGTMQETFLLFFYHAQDVGFRILQIEAESRTSTSPCSLLRC